jgi:hypothetical protein
MFLREPARVGAVSWKYPGAGNPSPPINYTKSVAMTKLEKELKREIVIDDKPYVVTISPQGLKLTEKGRRKGQELSWKDLVSGDAALSTALNASVESANS